MFATLKNKIKEETGNDLNKIANLLNSPLSNSSRDERHSRQNSGSSVSSLGITPEESSPSSLIKQDTNEIKLSDGKTLTQKEIKKLEKRELEWRHKLQKKDEEWLKKFDKKEEEWKKLLDDKQKEWKKNLEVLENEKLVLEEEKKEVFIQKKLLEDSLKVAEEYKKKVYQYQEDIDQLEGFQTQEMAKLKHLLLAKEQEICDRLSDIKESNNQNEILKSEINRLRRFEEEYSTLQDEMENLRHSTDCAKTRLNLNLAQTEEEVRHLRERVAVLEERTKAECAALGAELTVDERVVALLGERTRLERRLEEAHLHLADIKTSWSSKISSLETQLERLSRQAGEEGTERRRAEAEKTALLERIRALQVIVEQSKMAHRDLEEKQRHLLEEKNALNEELAIFRKESQAEIQKLKEQIEKHESEKLILITQYDDLEKKYQELETNFTKINISLDQEKTNNITLQLEINNLTVELDDERNRNMETNVERDRERGELENTLMRNAQVNQQMELARHELRSQERETQELHTRLLEMEENLKDKDKQLEKKKLESQSFSNQIKELEKIQHDNTMSTNIQKELTGKLSDLEEQLNEKNKSIKVLQQKLTDMKKTLQKELRVSSTFFENGEDSAAVLQPSSSKQVGPHNKTSRLRSDDDDVNFKYLKHVLIKFLTSREYEAQHLTRAVATLLRFSPEEERLLRETLDWKMSWFGTRPRLGVGQTSKTIPPS